MKKIDLFYIGVCALIITSCGTSRKAITSTPTKPVTEVQQPANKVMTDTVKAMTPQYLSSKLRLTLPSNMLGITLSGKMKMKDNERIQLSFVMPIFGSEMMKADITPNDMLLIDRHDKLYVQATKEELSKYLPKGSDFTKLSKMLKDASKPGGKSELSGSEIGLKSMKDAKIELFDFSTEEFQIVPTSAPVKYKRVTLEEFVKILKNIQ